MGISTGYGGHGSQGMLWLVLMADSLSRNFDLFARELLVNNILKKSWLTDFHKVFDEPMIFP